MSILFTQKSSEHWQHIFQTQSKFPSTCAPVFCDWHTWPSGSPERHRPYGDCTSHSGTGPWWCPRLQTQNNNTENPEVSIKAEVFCFNSPLLWPPAKIILKLPSVFFFFLFIYFFDKQHLFNRFIAKIKGKATILCASSAYLHHFKLSSVLTNLSFSQMYATEIMKSVKKNILAMCTNETIDFIVSTAENMDA